MKPRIYIETSVISYLTARPSLDAINAARQYESLRLWSATARYELVASSLVVDECSAGDADAAQRRLVFCKSLPLLPIPDSAAQTAQTMVDDGAFPESAFADALHVAIAAHHQCAAIASWNYRHLANTWARQRVEQSLRKIGLAVPQISTPDALVEDQS
jgi:predicted nucleic acid-binding protein